MSEAAGNGRRWTVVAGFAVSLFFLFGWFDRSAETSIDFVAGTSVQVSSDAGPVRVVSGETAMITHVDSWLFSRPRIEINETVSGTTIDVRCPGRFPCRSAVDLVIPMGTELSVVSSNGDVSVDRFDGALTISAVDNVWLGPISGSAAVASAQGEVFGAGMNLETLEVRARRGRIEVSFASPPGSVALTGGRDRVDVVVPDQLYKVTVETESPSVEILVDESTAVSRDISVVSQGAIRVAVG